MSDTHTSTRYKLFDNEMLTIIFLASVPFTMYKTCIPEEHQKKWVNNEELFSESLLHLVIILHVQMKTRSCHSIICNLLVIKSQPSISAFFDARFLLKLCLCLCVVNNLSQNVASTLTNSTMSIGTSEIWSKYWKRKSEISLSISTSVVQGTLITQRNTCTHA